MFPDRVIFNDMCPRGGQGIDMCVNSCPGFWRESKIWCKDKVLTPKTLAAFQGIWPEDFKALNQATPQDLMNLLGNSMSASCLVAVCYALIMAGWLNQCPERATTTSQLCVTPGQADIVNEFCYNRHSLIADMHPFAPVSSTMVVAAMAIRAFAAGDGFWLDVLRKESCIQDEVLRDGSLMMGSWSRQDEELASEKRLHPFVSIPDLLLGFAGRNLHNSKADFSRSNLWDKPPSGQDWAGIPLFALQAFMQRVQMTKVVHALDFTTAFEIIGEFAAVGTPVSFVRYFAVEAGSNTAFISQMPDGRYLHFDSLDGTSTAEFDPIIGSGHCTATTSTTLKGLGEYLCRTRYSRTLQAKFYCKSSIARMVYF
jgi:hypothetical protein